MDLLTSVGNQLISACKNQLLNFQEFFKPVDVISVPRNWPIAGIFTPRKLLNATNQGSLPPGSQSLNIYQHATDTSPAENNLGNAGLEGPRREGSGSGRGKGRERNN